MSTALTTLLAAAGIVAGTGATVVLALNYTGNTEFAGRLVPQAKGNFYDFLIGHRGAFVSEVVSAVALPPAPFYEHDHVQVLAGPHKGKRGRIEVAPCPCCWADKAARVLAERQRGRYEVRVDETREDDGRVITVAASALLLVDSFGYPLAFGPARPMQGELFEMEVPRG